VFGFRVGAGHAYGLIALSGEGLDLAGGTVDGGEVLEGVRAEQVLQRAWLTESAWGDVKAHVLGEDARGRAYRQYSDVWDCGLFKGLVFTAACSARPLM